MFDFDGNLIKGFMLTRAQKLIKEWCSLHKKELKENWESARESKPLNWVEPLR